MPSKDITLSICSVYAIRYVIVITDDIYYLLL